MAKMISFGKRLINDSKNQELHPRDYRHKPQLTDIQTNLSEWQCFPPDLRAHKTHKTWMDATKSIISLLPQSYMVDNQIMLYLADKVNRTDGQTMTNSNLPLLHFIRLRTTWSFMRVYGYLQLLTRWVSGSAKWTSLGDRPIVQKPTSHPSTPKSLMYGYILTNISFQVTHSPKSLRCKDFESTENYWTTPQF